jgi:tRNA A58 N-methylase Trm61
MKTVYTLTVRANVKIPTGTLNLDVGTERTYIFANITERQKILEWVRAQGWVHSTNIEHIMTADEVRKELTRSIEQTCERFHHPVPTFVEG